MPHSPLYDADFYAWANEQAALLRAGNLAAADIAHIAEEIESMGRTEKRELISRLTVLLLHVLKWRYQPARRGRSWEATIGTQRNALRRHMKDNPSLRPLIDDAMTEAYDDARLDAYGETDLPKSTFPATCPWSFAQIMDDTFWPEA